MNDKIILIDICGTLYNSNTTFDFLDFFVKKKSFIYFRKVSKWKTWRIFNKLLIITIKVDFTRRIAVRYLKNCTKQELETAMDKFYSIHLKHLKRPEVFNIINEYSKNENRLILISATLDFIAKKISIETGISEVYSTKLNYIDSFCSGSISVDLLSNKFNFLISQSIKPVYLLTITDNFSDILLLMNSEKSIIISETKDTHKWNSIIRNKMITNSQIINI